jgi:hypothetical protein
MTNDTQTKVDFFEKNLIRARKSNGDRKENRLPPLKNAFNLKSY